MQCKKEENLQNCSCSFPDCPRKGICCECVMHHRVKNEIPACFFPIDNESDTISSRTIENFIKSQKNKK